MKDFLGQELHVGDFVTALYSENETPASFQITGFTPKKVRVQPIDDLDGHAGLKYPQDMLKISEEAAERMRSEIPRDLTGAELKVGDYVFGSAGEYIDPVIFEIKRFVPRTAIVEKIYGPHYVRTKRRYTRDLVKVDPGTVTMYLLKKKYTEDE